MPTAATVPHEPANRCIQINTRSLLVDGGSTPIFNGEAIEVRAILSTATNGTGNSGNIIIDAQDQIVLYGSAIFSQAFSIGNSGSIQITTGSLIGTNISFIQSVTNDKGNAGNVTVNARDKVFFSGGIQDQIGSGIGSQVLQTASGNSGDINITTGSLTLQDNARLITSTLGKSDAGNIRVDVRDEVRLETSGNIFSTVEGSAAGNGGDIDITAGSLTLLGGSQLDASTFGQGDSGNIRINVRDTIFIDGVNPNIPDRSSSLFTEVLTDAKGNGGDIYVSTGSLRVTNGGQLDAKTRGRGNAGNIFITARDQVIFDGKSPIDGKPTRALSSVNREAAGNGGNIEISAGTLLVTNGAILTAETLGQGNAGGLVITTRDAVMVENQSQINARTSSAFKGGDIRITTDSLQLNNSTITVSSISAGDTGNILINARSAQLNDNAKIIAEAASQNGGNITFNIADLLLLRRGSGISTTAGTAQAGGNGGNITINGGFIIAIPKENSDITANAFSGAGGNVTITSPGIFGLKFRPNLTEFSDITASSDFGNSGTIQLNAPDNAVIQNGLTEFSQTFTDTTQLLANSCIVRSNKQNGRFVITGSGGLPQRPGDAPLSPFPTGQVRSVRGEERGGRGEEGQRKQGEQEEIYVIQNPTSGAQNVPDRPWKIGDPIVEPQGIYRLANGELVMSRECP